MLVLGLCLFFTRLVGRRFGRLVVLSSVVDSVLPSVILSSVVLSSVVRLVVAVGRLVVRRPVGCRLSAVGRCRRPSVAGRRLSCRSSVVGRPFPFPVLRLPNCRGTLSPTAFHHGRPVCLLPPPGLLTVSQLSSSRLQLTLPTTVWGVSPVPPFGFRLLASARRLPFLAFEAPFSSLAFPRLLEIASIPTLHVMHFLSFPILCFSHNHTHPFITRSTPIPSQTHSITHTHSMGHITTKTERSPQTRF